MKTHRDATDMEIRAAEALGTLLHQVSSIKTRNIKLQPAGAHRRGDILADIDVLGRSHQLVCSVADGDLGHMRKALQQLRTCVDRKATAATPMLITPRLSAQARAMCEENQIGFLDLEGNAHLVLDEVFIGKRSVHRAAPAAVNRQMSA